MKLFRNYPLLFPIIILFFFIIIAGYTVFDDSRVEVRHQDVTIIGLPPAFEGYTILQITDLHSQRFGESQRHLTDLINSLDFDAVAFTGDMQDSRSHDILPFLELLKGIQKKTPKFFISGNSGPFDISYSNYSNAPYAQDNIDISNGQVLDTGILIENVGCTLLDQPKAISRDGEKIWFAAKFSPIISEGVVTNAKKQLSSSISQGMKMYFDGLINYQLSLQKIYSAFQPSDTIIGVFHYPLSYQTLKDPHGLPPYDLIIAGHYHGGQVRIPFYGALFIPDNTLPLDGFFPPQQFVSGLIEENGIQEYISRGLGASSRLPFIQFRLFDTPEINLITLHRTS